MYNNDILVRLRYAFDIKDDVMMEIFALGDVTINNEDLQKMLVSQNSILDEDMENPDKFLLCSFKNLESFLNGFIIYKRGKQEPKEGQTPQAPAYVMNQKNCNNLLLKKVKIALNFSSEDMLEVFKAAGITVSKGELGALFRKEGHKNYKECGDKFARNFLKGLAIQYRG
ncbi:DUF1456 family protein [Chakrabartyella piscis]|uniref:DUF1456 family protein n=1 Tax=Chakrabartyella piscis TaxID=2918914 RepID=UPI002958344A|nr:DUF1456 family protein [Chakrabartyella piscis]